MSDIHIGHRKTTAQAMEAAFKDYLRKYGKEIKKSSIWIIAGDYWDRLLPYACYDIHVGISIGIAIMDFCTRHQISLRILEGTLSHDHHQSRIFTLLAKAFPTLDFLYVETIYIETLYDKKILYIPDDLHLHKSDTKEAVKDALEKHGILKVDFIFMHGQFPHQLPNLPGIEFDDDKYYTSICNACILVGHLHIPTRKGKIIAAGSFVPLSHGEDKDRKGGVLVDVSKKGELSVSRLYTHQEIYYTTIPVTPLKRAEELLDTLNGLIHIRLKGTGLELERYLSFYKEKYPSIFFTIKKTNKDERIETVKDKIKKWEEFTTDYVLKIIKNTDMDNILRDKSIEIFNDANDTIKRGGV